MWISKGEWVSEELKIGSRNENCIVLETLHFLIEIACARSAPRKKCDILEIVIRMYTIQFQFDISLVF